MRGDLDLVSAQRFDRHAVSRIFGSVDDSVSALESVSNSA